ncbi:MAG TPA: hypothetical protein VF682_20470 [Pseudomonas sp.]|jgi:hypothetical protein
MNAESLYEFFIWAWFVGTVGVLGFLGSVLILTYTKLEKLFEYLKNSHAVTGHSYYWESRIGERMAKVNRVIYVVARSGYFLHKGTVNRKDMKNFPPGLKKAFIVLHWVRVGSLWLWMVSFIALHLSWFAPSQQTPACYCQLNEKTGEIDYEIVR